MAAKVQELMAMRAEGKQRLQEVVEDIGQNLTPRQKGKLTLSLANRVSRFETDCDTRVENVLERVEQVEILTESERHLIQATVEDLSPEFCSLKERLNRLPSHTN